MKAASSSGTIIPTQFFCNGVSESKSEERRSKKISLEYRENQQTPQNMKLQLSNFIRSVFHLPSRILDLLEIAAYVFCADRHVRRGSRNAVEYHSWSRELEYFIKVRDYSFWSSDEVRQLLAQSLIWMTGDRSHSFNFFPGHKTNKAGCFDSKEFSPNQHGVPRIVLFSGGLDSLAGLVDLLEISPESVWPISHKSANPGTIRTQRQLIKALESRYPGRVNYRILECHLHKFRAPEESQRTRAFLYCSMALALAIALNQRSFYVYENGITALNFSKRGGMFNARASRTVHPKTIRMLQRLFCLVTDHEFRIETPFAFKTKTEVIQVLKNYSKLDLINSTVSCSKVFKELGQATHCGQCSQCIDRRFAAYAAECDSEDEGGIYAFDFIHESIEDGETRTGIIDFLRQARKYLRSNLDHFYVEMLDQLTDAIDEHREEFEQIEQIHSLCNRHGRQVDEALTRMVRPLEDYPQGALATILEKKDFFHQPVYSLAKQIAISAEEFIRRAFVHQRPVNENDLNAKIGGFLSGHKERFQREHPCLNFATAQAVPDHSSEKLDLLIETKYVRGSTTPSKATEGIAADLTKYPDEPLKLFIVYDPDGKIADRTKFKQGFEKKRHCLIHVI